jgi:outer membrane beta-barrel protein
MESRIRILLLAAALVVSTSACSNLRAWLDRDEPRETQPTEEELARAEMEDVEAAPPRVIEPEVERRRIKVPKIDTENVELGVHYGALSIEDFGTNPVYGVSAAYHVTEDFFFRAEIGRSTAGRTSFETLAGDIQLLTGDERQFTYYNLALGYNFLPGEVFLGRGLAMNSALYLIGGIGSVEFAGDQRFTVSFGAGYRVLPTDWLAVHITVEDRVFESDLLGSSKLTNNIEAHIGATVFF